MPAKLELVAIVIIAVACGGGADPPPVVVRHGSAGGAMSSAGSNGAGGTCTGDGDCDDGVVCTLDSCNAGACAHAPAPFGVSCDDGDPCNGDEICDLHGSCVQKDGVPCDGYACAATTGCLSSCNVGTDCAVGYSCAVGVCKAN